MQVNDVDAEAASRMRFFLDLRPFMDQAPTTVRYDHACDSLLITLEISRNCKWCRTRTKTSPRRHVDDVHDLTSMTNPLEPVV